MFLPEMFHVEFTAVLLDTRRIEYGSIVSALYMCLMLLAREQIKMHSLSCLDFNRY